MKIFFYLVGILVSFPSLAYESTNPVPYIPAQCYTNPVDDEGKVTNPCYTCHTKNNRPNYIEDAVIQTQFAFPEPAIVNPWKNYFRGFSDRAAQISNQQIIDYVRQNNLYSSDGKNLLASHLEENYAQYDANSNGRWDGYLPDIYLNFDNEGFDIDPTGKMTGWRAFAYYPFPGAFMPTNGSTDDVMIRLPSAFRQNTDGKEDREIYKLNLAILEALIKEEDVLISPTDESKLDLDLDKNGSIGMSSRVKYDWDPRNQSFMYFAGMAGALQKEGQLKVAAGLYPKDTEFLHTVRYLDLDDSLQVKMSARIKELRYGRKTTWLTYFDHEQIAGNEIKERHDFPARTKVIQGTVEKGVFVPQGWVYQGFIEDSQGALRPQSLEEQQFCAGCHSGIGVITDTTFAFKRKFNSDSFQQGWYHWSQKGLSNVPDPARKSDGKGEFAFYLENNPTGDEYRSNQEVKEKFFFSDGSKKVDAFDRLSQDISELLLPSPERALMLNKAYKALVEEQSFKDGRESMLVADDVIYKEVELDQPTGILEELSFY